MRTVYFTHSDALYLEPIQRNGGAAFIPPGVDPKRPAPLAIVLHGTNSSATPHLWLGGGGRDLRPVAESLILAGETVPFVLAGPSQTRAAAAGRGLWAEFDLAAFLADLRAATEAYARIDEQRIVLIGHSGAGCNPNGGLASDFAGRSEVRPFALVAIDPCLDAEMGRAFLHASSNLPLFVFWQTQTWPRDPLSWFAALSSREVEPELRVLEVEGRNPHEAIVALAFATTVRKLFPGSFGNQD